MLLEACAATMSCGLRLPTVITTPTTARTMGSSYAISWPAARRPPMRAYSLPMPNQPSGFRCVQSRTTEAQSREHQCASQVDEPVQSPTCANDGTSMSPYPQTSLLGVNDS